MSETLPPRQQELVIFIRTYLKAYGIAPSYDDIGVAIGLTARSAVMKEVIALERAGFIRRRPACNNAIEALPTEDYHAAQCPCSACADRRYFRDLQLVHALEVEPPAWLDGCILSNLRFPEPSSQSSAGAL